MVDFYDSLPEGGDKCNFENYSFLVIERLLANNRQNICLFINNNINLSKAISFL